MTTCELRKRAARVIQERGWCQEEYGGEQSGPVCLVGAINVARGTRTTADLPDDLADALGFDDEDAATYWNDKDGRTQAEVIARLLDGCEGGEDR